MKKTIPHTIGEWILSRTAYGKSLTDLETMQNAPAQANVVTDQFIKSLLDAGFRFMGHDTTLRFEVRYYESSDNSVHVWIHKAGDLYRVYQHVNNNHLPSVLKMLTEPDFRIDLAKGALDRAVKRINEKVAIANGAVDLVVTNFATPEQEIEFLEDCVIRASKQLLLAE